MLVCTYAVALPQVRISDKAKIGIGVMIHFKY